MLIYPSSNANYLMKYLSGLGFEVVSVERESDLAKILALIMPGVGNFRSAVTSLVNSQLDSCLRELKNKEMPILGICLGMQLLFSHSYEDSENEQGNHGLGILPGSIESLGGKGLSVPIVGWQEVHEVQSSILLRGVADKRFYFNHSFGHVVRNPSDFVKCTDLSGRYSTIVEWEGIFGVQFHPEKSYQNGELIIRNFLSYALQGIT